ncbi:MAG: hypothetical protein M3Z05_11565 [Gemmatimonadota bacterium]|nr:hypothetical protein [Gemmatimonadota bacterium]
MSIREYTDSRRVEWRVWDVTPSQMHPLTRDEQFLEEMHDGWLVFESTREKRRLNAPYPRAWRTFDIPQLEELCQKATPVLRRKAKSPSGEYRAITTAAIEREAEVESRSRRTFKSPRGREWTVRIHECLDREKATQKVLRFTAGDIVVELLEWPDDWETLSVVDYGVLLLDAEPPRRRPKGQGPQRRHEDMADTEEKAATRP